jgi:hypothetical protein
MTVSVKAAKKAAVRRFATAAAVAAALSTAGAAHGAGDAMPANCQQNLNRCSLKIWGHNAFSQSGETRSITFSNGKTLTCTSHGKDTPRGCTLN